MNIDMDLDLTFFADRLKFLRRVHNLTQENVAHACGLTTRTIEKLESGRHNPSEQTVRGLCRGLAIDRGYFVKPSAAEEARQKAELLTTLRTTAVVHTTIVRTAQAIMQGVGGTHAWNLDVGSVGEEVLPMAAALTDHVTDWSEIWDEISMSEQATAATGLSESCHELEAAGYLVHLGRYQASRRFASGAPLVFTFGLLSIRSAAESENQSVALVPLTGGWELLEKDVPTFDAPG
ncbi:helix-turn-helix transcriptional regulator [Brevundimonas diminuta]|uniref:helix-turn-helix domain-containing protein n=1 Tax=Brevundimonas TaxID=41275 RepID=UPI00190891FA|nr:MULTISPECIES: helix-turn-helix transcriptional regulator [Brevundimonas]MBK1976264.1 helix-turn-helix transcriptional regulator [Brevundimonas diminuta]